MSNRFEGLNCIRCGDGYPLDTHTRCTKCEGILTATYKINPDLSQARDTNGIWRFADYLPPVSKQNVVTLGEGSTPYVETPHYARKARLTELWCKLEGSNPTGSFKDRAASLGLSLAREWGKKGVFTISTGNAGAATSAYAARAGLRCLILIRDDSPAAKISQIAMYSPAMLRVHGVYDSRSALERAFALTQGSLPGWLNHFLWAPINPLLVDAFKTVSYEMASDPSKIPDYIFVPVGGGDLIYGMYKGFMELKEMGVVASLPKLVAVQGEGANATVSAIESGAQVVAETETANTVAEALRINFGAEHSIVAVNGSRGFGIATSDAEIIEAQREIAKLDGVFCELSSATALSAISKAVAAGRINRDDRVAAILTGSGFKDFRPAIEDISQIPLAKSVESIPDAVRQTLQA